MLHLSSQDEVSLKTSSHGRLIFAQKMEVEWTSQVPVQHIYNPALVCPWCKHSCKARHQFGKQEWDWRTSDHNFGSTFWHCLCQMPADRLSPPAKGPVPQAPQEYPSEGSSGSDMEQARIEKHLDPLGCLAIWFCSLQRELYSSMQGHQLDTRCQHCHVAQGNSQQGPK